MSLAEARNQRDDARKFLMSGIDPGAHRKALKFAGHDRDANSFEVVARTWVEQQRSTWTPAHASRTLSRLERDAFPPIGKKPVEEIAGSELLAIAMRVVERGAVETAHRLVQNFNQIFRYAVLAHKAPYNVAGDLKGALPRTKIRNHPALSTALQIGGLLRAIDGYEGSIVTRSALQLAALTFVRPGELRHAEWSEIDLQDQTWRIPASKMKMEQEHWVPLSEQAIEVLLELQPLTARSCYVFPNPRSRERPMSNNAVLAALRRMDYAKDEMSGHGFRAIARTRLDEVLGCNTDWIEHQLAHAVRDVNGRAYNRTTHMDNRRAMMQRWADHLDELRNLAADDSAKLSRRGNRSQSRPAPSVARGTNAAG